MKNDNKKIFLKFIKSFAGIYEIVDTPFTSVIKNKLNNYIAKKYYYRNLKDYRAFSELEEIIIYISSCKLDILATYEK